MATSAGKSKMLLLMAILCLPAVMALSSSDLEGEVPDCGNTVGSCVGTLVRDNAVEDCEDTISSCESKVAQNVWLRRPLTDDCCKDFASPANSKCACRFRDALSAVFPKVISPTLCLAHVPACDRN